MLTLRKFFLLFSFGLLVAGCDRVKESPEPDPLQGLELKPLQKGLITNSSLLINLAEEFNLPGTVAFSILSQPAHGSLTLVPPGSLLYQPNTGFSGTDIALYQICAGSNCITDTLIFSVSDTTPPCVPGVADTTLFVNAGQVNLGSVWNFGCGAGITGILQPGSTFELLGQTLIGNFASNRVDTNQVKLISCAENRCDTGTYTFISGLSECQAKFQARDDNRTIKSLFSARSFFIKDFTANDSTCFGDLDLSSFEIVSQPLSGDSIKVLPPTTQGRTLRIIRRQPLSNAPFSFEYRIRSRSNTTSTARVFITID
jgi:hypothetical protein